MEGGAWVAMLSTIVGLVGAYLRVYTGHRIAEAETRILEKTDSRIEKLDTDLGGKIDRLSDDMVARMEREKEMRDLYKLVANLDARVGKG